MPAKIATRRLFAGAFSPRSIPGLTPWLRADAGAGLADGDPVGTWTDQNGVMHATQATAANKPTYKTAILNGLPIVRFDGVDDQLTTPSYPVALPYPYTVLIVFKNTIFKDYNVICNDLTTHNAQGLHGNSANIYLYNGSAALVGITTSAFKLLYIEWNGANSKYAVNGAALSGPVDPGTLRPTLSGLSIGAETFFYPLAGDIAEVLVYNSALSTANKAALETYLNSKWALY